MTTHDRISIGGFVSLGALVVALGGLMFLQIDDVDSRIGRVEERLNDRIDDVNVRIDDVNVRIDGVETRMSGLEEAIRELGERMARFEGTLSAVVALVGLNEAPDSPGGEAAR